MDKKQKQEAFNRFNSAITHFEKLRDSTNISAATLAKIYDNIAWYDGNSGSRTHAALMS